MMASAVTTGPNALRVDAVFYKANDLAGLIWEAEDRWDHPLLAYQTARDFRRCVLRFRWRSGGIVPLDAVHGPTLTIEGRDAAGQPRSWFVLPPALEHFYRRHHPDYRPLPRWADDCAIRARRHTSSQSEGSPP